MSGKNGDQLDALLRTAADMESFAPADDSLTYWAESFADGELSEDDLSFVAAASSGQSYAAFRERFHLDTEK